MFLLHWLLPDAGELKLHLYHCDHLGTPVALINHKTGKVEWDAILDVWGNAVDIFNPYKLRQPIRMQGQHYDEESELHYNRHRYYDPALGRYITQDPIGLRGGWNVYSYVNNNPVSLIDPMGLDTMVLVGGATQGNPIGHSALAFSGHGVYSYSTRTMYGSSTSDYLNSQAMKRDTKAYILKTNLEQEKKMRDFIEKNYQQNARDYNKANHNCATMISDAFSSASVANNIMLEAIFNGLYPQLPPTIGYVAGMVSDSSGRNFPKGAPLPSDIQTLNPGVRNE